MTHIYMVRHGRASAGWDTAVDPDLDEIGQHQAERVADELFTLTNNPLTIVSSPLARCRQTAQPLATKWGIEPIIQNEVAEIPSPEGVDMSKRVEWLRVAMTKTWTDLGDRYTTYRDTLVNYVSSLTTDTVIFSHFVAINAVIGHATQDDQVLTMSLDNCSVTVFEKQPDGTLMLKRGGREADTLIR